ncbi:MAG: RNA 2',3'-cyclic phosphodiesterase [Magnetococcales bacterium]|nr:RNA 2',3'-cyclic phosphodiesterase [Magnetococcales bacterium]
MADSMRLFIGFAMPEDLRHCVAGLAGEARSRLAGWRWVVPENYHLTARFLGEVPAADLAGWREALGVVAAAHPPFSLTVSGWGVFPDARRARVLWLGIREPEERPLSRLVRDVAALPPLSQETRSFRPHLTLARAQAEIAEAPTWQQEPTMCATPWPIDELLLYQSSMRPEGVRYRVLHRAQLAAG